MPDARRIEPTDGDRAAATKMLGELIRYRDALASDPTFEAREQEMDVEHVARLLAAERAATVEKCAAICDRVHDQHRARANQANKKGQYGKWSQSDGAAILADSLAAALRAQSGEVPR